MTDTIWLGDGYAHVGQELQLTGGYTGTATITAILPIRDIPAGTPLIDTRTCELAYSDGMNLRGTEGYIRWPGFGAGCCMPDELFPVITLADDTTTL